MFSQPQYIPVSHASQQVSPIVQTMLTLIYQRLSILDVVNHNRIKIRSDIMSKDKEREIKHPKNDDFYDAPESGTVVHEEDPAKRSEAHNDQAKDSIGEAPESGTIREK